MTDDTPTDSPHAAAPDDQVPDFTDEERDLTDSLSVAAAGPRPPAPPAPHKDDELIREMVARELEHIEQVMRYMPRDDNEILKLVPPHIRTGLWNEVEVMLEEKPPIQVITGADLLAPPLPTDWLINDLITAADDGGRVLVAGPEKSFKSLFALGCLVAIASGEPLFGFEHWSVREPGDVLAFMGEGGAELNRNRIARIMQGQSFSEAKQLETANRIELTTDVITPPSAFTLHLESRLKQRTENEDRANFKLVIVDSLYVYGGDTERSQLAQMGTLLVNWAGVCEKAGATLMVVDHFRKHVESLELSSVNGVGASQWAQAWSLLKAKYNPATDAARLSVSTGARQSAGGIYRITVSGVMHGPVMPKVETIRPEDLDDDSDVAGNPKSKTDAVIRFNQLCRDKREWVTRSKIVSMFGAEAADHVLAQPHVQIVASPSKTNTWAYAVDSTGELPAKPPRGGSDVVQEATPPKDTPEPEPADD